MSSEGVRRSEEEACPLPGTAVARGGRALGRVVGGGTGGGPGRPKMAGPSLSLSLFFDLSLSLSAEHGELIPRCWEWCAGGGVGGAGDIESRSPLTCSVPLGSTQEFPHTRACAN